MAVEPFLIDAVKGFEGYNPNSSWDYKQYSSGYGTKVQPGDENIPQDQRQAVYEQRLKDNLEQAAAHVDKVNPNLPPGARNALISLTYNAGPGWANSGLGDLVRSGDLQGAKARLLEYNKTGGKENAGLVSRRSQEAAWFDQTPQSPQQAAPAPVSAQQPSQPLPLSQMAQAAPTFSPPPAAPQGGGGPSMAFTPPAVAPPVFAPLRQPTALSKLRAAMASGNRGLFLDRG